MREPRTPTPMTARTKNRPASMTWPTAPWPGPMGMARRTRRYGSRATAGASWKMRRSALAGTTSSFCANFTPSATSWAQPWKPPAYMGPRRPCMWAITLCSVCPTTSGSTRKTAKTTISRRATSRTSFTRRLRCRWWGRSRDGPWVPVRARSSEPDRGPARGPACRRRASGRARAHRSCGGRGGAGRVPGAPPPGRRHPGRPDPRAGSRSRRRRNGYGGPGAARLRAPPCPCRPAAGPGRPRRGRRAPCPGCPWPGCPRTGSPSLR